MNTKLKKIEDILEMENGTLNEIDMLVDIEEWDSVAALSFILMLDEDYGRSISAEEVKNLKTVGDMIRLMEN